MYVSGNLPYNCADEDNDTVLTALEQSQRIYQHFSWASPHGEGVQSFREMLLHEQQLRGFVVINRWMKGCVYGEDQVWFIDGDIKPTEADFHQISVVCWVEIIGQDEVDLIQFLNIIANTRANTPALVRRWVYEFIFHSRCDLAECIRKCDVQVRFGPATCAIFHNQFATVGGMHWLRNHNYNEVMFELPHFFKQGVWTAKDATGMVGRVFAAQWPTLYVQRLISLDVFGSIVDLEAMLTVGRGCEMLYGLSLLFFWLSGDGLSGCSHLPRTEDSITTRVRNTFAKNENAQWEADDLVWSDTEDDSEDESVNKSDGTEADSKEKGLEKDTQSNSKDEASDKETETASEASGAKEDSVSE